MRFSSLRLSSADRTSCGSRLFVIKFSLLLVGCAAIFTDPVMMRIGAAGELAEPVITGELCTWAPMTISFRGPDAKETADAPNPFLDYRMQVELVGPSGQRYDVPGFFDGNGDGRGDGHVWRIRFAPDEAGKWSYQASFRKGQDIAISLDLSAGESAACDGQSGAFDVTSQLDTAPGFLKWGRLEYAGGHYLKFRDGPYWIRGGTDSPENLLAYAGFDNTPPSHKYSAHREDWRTGDPDWGDGDGRAIIGALNYLASKHVNSIYFLTMNIGGDGGDVFPWTGTPVPKGSPENDNLHFDISKLTQWETVFTHAQRTGLFLHFVFNEAEEQNKRELDGGELGRERKLYYRETIARFGHHLALEWNLCEEYNLGFDLGPERVRSFADYVRSVDPYDHPVTVHSYNDPLKALRFTFGDPRFSMTSIQLNQRRIDTLVEKFREATARAGRPLPISMDEFTINKGQRSWEPIDDAERHRKEKLWPTYLSGGNIEFILADLLGTESFKTPERAKLWDYVWYARRFVEGLPFPEMHPADELIDAAHDDGMRPQVFAKQGEVYAIYLPTATNSGSIDLSKDKGTFKLRWYNPRTGRFEGDTIVITAEGKVPLGIPPSATSDDWVVLIRKTRARIPK